ncbi:MAG: hypothetical protein OXC48_02150 [Endozoicomonadaceae bacterium]|nr:hypothetical protein [Endozoicomonadaceae bacterium]
MPARRRLDFGPDAPLPLPTTVGPGEKLAGAAAKVKKTSTAGGRQVTGTTAPTVKQTVSFKGDADTGILSRVSLTATFLKDIATGERAVTLYRGVGYLAGKLGSLFASSTPNADVPVVDNLLSSYAKKVTAVYEETVNPHIYELQTSLIALAETGEAQQIKSMLNLQNTLINANKQCFGDLGEFAARTLNLQSKMHTLDNKAKNKTALTSADRQSLRAMLTDTNNVLCTLCIKNTNV